MAARRSGGHTLCRRPLFSDRTRTAGLVLVRFAIAPSLSCSKAPFAHHPVQSVCREFGRLTDRAAAGGKPLLSATLCNE